MRPITPELLIRAYASGIFPMARSHDDPRLYWIDPDQRGVLPLETFHIPRSLKKTLRKQSFEIRCNTAFEDVIRGCGEITSDRDDTWINDEIVHLFMELHQAGMAHSVETWRDGRLMGGLYGLSLGAAFFGESMFSRATDASKVALVHLVARLKANGFTLLDTQFITEHLTRFGACEIPRTDYLRQLAQAMERPASFQGAVSVPWEVALGEVALGEVGEAASPDGLLWQSSTQIS